MSRRKPETTYLCRNCGEDYGKWFGKCPNCGEWNSLVEFRPPSDLPGRSRAGRGQGGRGLAGRGGPGRSPRGARPRGSESNPAASLGEPGGRTWHQGERDPGFEAGVQLLGDVSVEGPKRIASGMPEFDRVLGGGLVPGAVILIGGDPGVGKSTLLLQVASRLVAEGRGVLYVSGEESAGQTRLRAQRLGVDERLAVLAEADLERVIEAVGEGAPLPEGEAEATDAPAARPVDVLFVDSIQAAYLPDLPSAPGSVMQVREGALLLTQVAKRRNVTVVLVGHVTKEGNLAGPRTLEHIVDAVLTMEGERFHAHRLLRSVKNRFGSVHEIGVFEMRDDGMHEVRNPSELFLGEGAGHHAGSAVVAGIEGTRSLMVEVQALVHPSRYGVPQRIATGFDQRRLAILLAVLVKRGGIDVSANDVFVNVVGGLRMDEPGVDLGLLLAVASSALERPLGEDLAAFGEVGLGGEVRRVRNPERRIQEAVRLGFPRVLLPRTVARDLESRGWKAPEGCRLLPVATLEEALAIGLKREKGDRDRT